MQDELVYPRERTLGTITLVLGIIAWLLIIVGTVGIALVYLLIGFLFYLFAQSALIAWLRGNGVLLSSQQLPDLRERFDACCARLGLDQDKPEAYLLQGGGVLNAFATRFLGRHYVVLLSDIVDAMQAHPDGINFYFGHELGHVRMKHLTGRLLRAPVLWLPLLGAAYSRAKESTCDRHGRACCESPESAARAMVALAAGARALARGRPAGVRGAGVADARLLDVVPRADRRLPVAHQARRPRPPSRGAAAAAQRLRLRARAVLALRRTRRRRARHRRPRGGDRRRSPPSASRPTSDYETRSRLTPRLHRAASRRDGRWPPTTPSTRSRPPRSRRPACRRRSPTAASSRSRPRAWCSPSRARAAQLVFAPEEAADGTRDLALRGRRRRAAGAAAVALPRGRRAGREVAAASTRAARENDRSASAQEPAMTSPFRSTAVVGAGAVGSFFGAMLARAGHPVTLIARPAHVEAIERAGLRLQMARPRRGDPHRRAAPTSTRFAAPTSSSSASSRPTPRPSRARWRRTSPTARSSSACRTASRTRRRSRATCARRSCRRSSTSRRRCPSRASSPTTAAAISSSGRSTRRRRRTPALAARLQALVELFATAQVPVRISADVMAELWSKLMVNCAYNAISGLAQASYGKLAALAEVRALQETVVREVVALAAGRRRRTCRSRPRSRRCERIAAAMPAQLSSTAQDMARGKPSEIDHLNGFVARRGARARHRHAGEPGAARAGQAGRERGRAWRGVDDATRQRASTCRRSSRRRCASSASPTPASGSPARRSPAASRRTSGASTPRAARSAPSARSPSCASPPTGARRSSATATRRAGSRSPTTRGPAPRRACSASTSASASSS